MPGLQAFINANPVLAVAAAFSIGIIAFLAVRILLASAGCLVRVAVALAIVIVIALLLRTLLAR
jgi:hypothetical protein